MTDETRERVERQLLAVVSFVRDRGNRYLKTSAVDLAGCLSYTIAEVHAILWSLKKSGYVTENADGHLETTVLGQEWLRKTKDREKAAACRRVQAAAEAVAKGGAR